MIIHAEKKNKMLILSIQKLAVLARHAMESHIDANW